MSKPEQLAIVDVPSPGHLGGVCSELISALCTAFSQEGVEVSFYRDRIPHDVPVLLFSFYRLFIDDRIPGALPGNVIVFNLSPLKLGKYPWYDNYVRTLPSYPVVDYSPANLEFLNHLSVGKMRSHWFKFGYAPLNAFTYPRRNSTYLFYGTVTEYRAGRIKAISKAGVPLQVLNKSWGHERDLQIATARAVINISRSEHNILEVYRIWHSLCMGTPVVSEPGSDPDLVDNWSPYVLFQESIDLGDAGELPFKNPELFKANTSMQENARALLRFIESVYSQQESSV